MFNSLLPTMPKFIVKFNNVKILITIKYVVRRSSKYIVMQ